MSRAIRNPMQTRSPVSHFLPRPEARLVRPRTPSPDYELDEALARSLQDQIDELDFYADVQSTFSSSNRVPGQSMDHDFTEAGPSTPRQIGRSSSRSSRHRTEDPSLPHGRGHLTEVKCRRCGPIRVQFKPAKLDAHPCLHVRCPECGMSQCRACLRPLVCRSTRCSGGEGCAILKCCPGIRSIAIFEILSTFDAHYFDFTQIAQHGGPEARQGYLTALLKPIDDPARTWEGRTIAMLKSLNTAVCTADDSRENASMDLRLEMFRQSYIMELFRYILLNKEDAAVWLSHFHLFSTILETISALISSGYQALFTEPYRRIRTSPGLAACAAGSGNIEWEDSQTSSRPLFSSMRELDRRRRQINAIMHNMSVPEVLSKMTTLTTQMSYLLMQQAEL